MYKVFSIFLMDRLRRFIMFAKSFFVDCERSKEKFTEGRIKKDFERKREKTPGNCPRTKSGSFLLIIENILLYVVLPRNMFCGSSENANLDM